MKLIDLWEAREPRILAPEEINSLSGPTPQNINAQYKVGKVIFDNVNGMGAVPNNQDVKYMGFAMSITSADFGRLAHAGNRLEAGRTFAEVIQKGAPIGTPFLQIDINYEDYMRGKPLQVKVTGHEGRARMLAISMINGPTTEMPIHVFLHHIRARDLNDKFFSDLRNTGIIPQMGFDDSNPIKIKIGPIFWQGETV